MNFKFKKKRGGERVRYSLSSLVAGGATWFAPGLGDEIRDSNTPSPSSSDTFREKKNSLNFRLKFYICVLSR